MNRQENTKKTPIQHVSEINGGVEVACNLTGSYIIITKHFQVYNKMINTKNTFGRSANLLLTKLVGTLL